MRSTLEICLSEDQYYRRPYTVGGGHGAGSLIETAPAVYDGSDKPKGEGKHHKFQRPRRDNPSYRGADSGCPIATEYRSWQYIGYSSCFDCPFGSDCRDPR